MGLTFKDIILMPANMGLEEYENKIKQVQKLKKRLSNICGDIDAEEDSLSVLADEPNSDRYKKHLEAKEKLLKKQKDVHNQLDVLLQELGR